MKLKARIIFEWEYDADPKYYETDDPIKAAENEMMWIENTGDIFDFLELCPNEPRVEIVPIEDKIGNKRRKK